MKAPSKPLYSSAAIAERVVDIADEINRDFAGEELVHAIVTLNGAFMFAADLIRHLDVPLVLHFAGATSYYGTEQGDLRINANALPKSFGNKPVLLIEDIMDTGNTVGQLRKIIADRFSGQIKVAALLRRQSGGGKADYYAFTVPRGIFVIGYGMDMDGRYRELKDICAYGQATMTSDGNQGLC
tara:strand:- start:91 stop:642 length:552 start_codon:yes stop_codon:yes gene_type:complete